MKEISVRRFWLRVLAFLIVIFLLRSFRSFLQLVDSQFESVFLGWLPIDPTLGILENPAPRIPLDHLLQPAYKKDNVEKPKLLGVASSITILSLLTRLDRRQDMNTLRLLLGIPESDWTYADAVASTDKKVGPILDWVQYVRSTFLGAESSNVPKYPFAWPDNEDIEKLVKSDATLDLWHTHPWVPPFGIDLGSSPLPVSFPANSTPLVPCMIKNFTFPFSRSVSTIPTHRILTPARIACWYSHLKAIEKIANSPVQDKETAIILEDDVDIESDIVEQLDLLWEDLPRRWDVVFLGHCWSNESHHPPLSLSQPHRLHNLHPSHHPQCTHAYVLSRTGARRILLHLRYPPFAFSRAIDQALAWLVKSGRIKAFSVVPSLVVQRKVRQSDVTGRKGGKGSKWKEKLRNGILENSLGGDQ